ncbi:Ubiquitin carboxyl-terminal hydrolase 38 [Liparis tanakae]|uniref:Ubiquitin carboxyl-terminal hydrolase n=1 Tax=Liparis tanakae TaxID=230148 RepID=A0A4Z2JJT8_9TELE|nr:Ubiquitin carboxyl-terminal hydrolase 38 [Liparis tanakae]
MIMTVIMDKILEGLVSSDHSVPVKRAIVKKVVEAAEKEVTEEQCQALFTLTTRLILLGEDAFQRQIGFQVLEAYARYHRPEFEHFFSKDFVLGLLQQGYGPLDRKHPAVIDYIHCCLRLVISCPSVLEIFSIVQVEVLRMVCERPEPALCAHLSTLLSDFVQCIPREKSGVLFCQQLVRTISYFHCFASQEEELREYVDPSFDPSIALASLVQHIPVQMITVLIKSLTTDHNVKDANMTKALCRMIDWLSWPLAQHVDTWVIALLKGLAAVQKFTILIDVTLLKIELVVPHVVHLVRSLRTDGLPTSKAFLLQFTELIHCMMYQYSGFPDLYDHIVEAIKDLPNPGEEKIKLVLNQSAWTSQSNSFASGPLRQVGKSETGKTGLVNLGNTCFLNSIIQTLFMATELHEEEKTLQVLESVKPKVAPPVDTSSKDPTGPTSPENGEESSLTPAEIKPENDGRTLIERAFGGKLITGIRCMQCNGISEKEEPFTDLSLAFCPSASQGGSQPEGPSEEPKVLCQGSVNGGSEIPESASAKAPASSVQFVPETNEPPLSVPDLVNYFLAPEILDEENAYFCEKCSSLQRAERTMKVVSAPEYLILTLLRFSYDAKCHVRRKILDNVDSPESSENLAKKLKPSQIDEEEEETERIVAAEQIDSGGEMSVQSVPYVLSSVVMHSGISSESGHYYSYGHNINGADGAQHPADHFDLKDDLGNGHPECRLSACSALSVAPEQGNTLPNSGQEAKDWLLFNDSRVTFTSFQSVQNITNRFPKDTAYVLMYRKQEVSGQNINGGLLANGMKLSVEPPLQKELLDAIIKDNKLYLQEQELNARTQALQAPSSSCSFRPNGSDDNNPPGSCGPSGGGGGGGGFNTISRLVF